MPRTLTLGAPKAEVGGSVAAEEQQSYRASPTSKSGRGQRRKK